MNTRIVGRGGEDIAVKFLKKQKYKIVARNYNCHFGEIDVIAIDGDYLVFAEVKSRKNTSFGMPREAVDFRKQQSIIKVAQHWMINNRVVGVPVRFDVVEVLDGNPSVIKDAFRA